VQIHWRIRETLCLLYPEEWEGRFHHHGNAFLLDYMTSHPTFRFCIVSDIVGLFIGQRSNSVELLRTKTNSRAVIHSYSNTNQLHQFLKFIYFCITSYMFRTVSPSIIRSSTLYVQQQAYVKTDTAMRTRWNCSSISFPLASRWQYLFDICLLLYVQCWTPDDGQRDCLKCVECFTRINTLRNWCNWLDLL
jgi:hypothetical protein